MASFLIVTDLDSTLVGNDESLRDFNTRFTQHRNIHGSKLVYATGRSLHLYEQLRPNVDLLPPDMLITSVGSEIYTANNEMDRGWANHLSEGWNVEIVQQITDQYEQLIPQAASEQGRFKVSFSLEPRNQSILADLRQEFEAQNIRAQVIYSGDRDVDVLPERSGKGNALNHVREELGMPCVGTVACGDSGNDIALFADRDIFGIIVGNAMQELIEWYERNSRPNLYLAKGSCAAGILEGLSHFNFL
jgi:sucrose-6-phosphatase